MMPARQRGPSPPVAPKTVAGMGEKLAASFCKKCHEILGTNADHAAESEVRQFPALDHRVHSRPADAEHGRDLPDG